MEVIISKIDTDENNLSSKVEVLNHLEEKVKAWMNDHISKRRLWFSSDYLPADEKMDDNKESVIKKLRERARGIKDSVRVAVAINLLTEEGLPHFHRIIGGVLRDYARDARLFSFREIELMQFHYQESGFNPDWDKDPYKVFVYTTLQERATQISHKNTGTSAGADEPLLEGILSSIAADEAKHFTFYRNVFKAILEIDPTRALQSAAAIMPAIDMPGLSMPNFREMADVVRRVGIYGPWDYKKIVEEAIKFWNIELLTGLNEAAAKAQEKILSIPKRLGKVAEYIEQRTTKKTFSFDFIYNRILVFE